MDQDYDTDIITNMPFSNSTDYLLYDFNFTDFFIDSYDSKWGPEPDPLSVPLTMTLVYAILLITGVTGNICTCIVISRNRYMHTATNYYLFSLAISDLLLLILGIPLEIYQFWVHYPYPYILETPGYVLRGLTTEMTTNASILTIIAFTVERYVAICHPFRARAMSHLSRAVKTIICIWIVSVLLALPIPLNFFLMEKVSFNTLKLIDKLLSHFISISTGLFFVLPIGLISVLYVLIFITIRKSRFGNTRNKGVIRMLIAVVISFFICWSPYHAQRLLVVYTTYRTPTLWFISNILYYISGVTFYLSVTINPIFYQLMSVKFRQAFKDTFSRCLRSETLAVV